MSDDTYKGESPGKKLARVLWWEQTRVQLGDHWQRGTKLVLAGRGGDISTLMGLGVPEDQIIAVDRVKSSVDECRERFPGVRVIHDDVENVAYALPKDRKCSVIFLDFCSSYCEQVVKTSFRCALAAGTQGTILGVGMLRGRERPKTTGARTAIGNAADEELQRLRKERPDFARQLGLGKTPAWTDERTKIDLRFALLVHDLMKRGTHVGLSFIPVGEVRYQSATSEEQRGVPMGYYRMRSINQKRWVDDGNTIDQLLRLGHHYSIVGQIFDKYESAEASVRWSAIKAAEVYDNATAARLFDVEQATVIAWRAHASRGTYGIRPKFKDLIWEKR